MKHVDDPRAAWPLPQRPEFARALTRVGGEVRVLSTPGGDMTAQVILRRIGPLRVALASRGPLWLGAPPSGRDWAEGLRGLRRVLPPRTVLIFSPEATPPATPGLRVMTPVTLACLDLTGTAHDRLARAKGKWRNRLMRARDAGHRITRSPLPADPGHWLLEVDRAAQRAGGYRNWPAPLIAAYADENPGQAVVFEARSRGEVTSAALILCHGATATYQAAWSSVEGRERSVQAAVLWAAAEWLAERGVSRFELGPIDTENAPGLARFKLGTGARAVRLGGTWALPPRLV